MLAVRRQVLSLSIISAFATLLAAGCQASGGQAEQRTLEVETASGRRALEAPAQPAMSSAQEGAFGADEGREGAGSPFSGEPMMTAPAASPLATPPPHGSMASLGLGRKIIKDAVLNLEVADVHQALGRLEMVAADLGGYVLETTTHGVQERRERATIRLVVPVDRFETALERIRRLAVRIESEEASGIDVTQEYVDLESEIANLEATRARVRELLQQARNVEEALAVNAELSRIEGEINQRKGRLQYLAQRSAMSTILVNLVGPELEPTATPTLRPTPTPTPLPPWQPGPIVRDSLVTLQILMRGLATVLIRLLLVLAPLLLVIGLPIAFAVWLVRRWRSHSPAKGS